MNKIYILCVVFVWFAVASCIPTKLQQYKVRIVDAESGAPAPAAVIDLYYYPHIPEQSDPNHPRATADAQGEVTMRSKAAPTIWQVQAEGYIEQRLSTNNGALPPRYAAHATDDYDGVVHLYQMPAPQLTIQVENTYTGPLTINLQPAPGFDYILIDEINVAFAAVDPQASYIQDAPGQRVFLTTASAEGAVELVVTPLLYDIDARGIAVRDSSGILPYRDIANPQDVERGVWGHVIDDDKRLHRQIRLFVGALEDYRRFLDSVP